jgi:hypothetical protein
MEQASIYGAWQHFFQMRSPNRKRPVVIRIMAAGEVEVPWASMG